MAPLVVRPPVAAKRPIVEPIMLRDTRDHSQEYFPHLGESREYWRDIILGFNDGLVSIFLLVAGVVGGGLSVRQVLLTGIAGAVAGAISMAVGEYIATKSQEEVFQREMALEREHLKYHRPKELEELKQMLADTGISEPLLTQVVEAYDADDDALMQIMAALELGIIDDRRRSPITAAFASGGLFLAGSLPSLMPFVFATNVSTGLLWAAILSGVGLFGLGAGKTYVTGTNPITSGLENLLISTVGAIASFGIGRAYDVYVG